MHREHSGARAGQHEEHGFTLIELLMVILIIAILVAVLIPVFIGASTRAKDRAMQSSLHTALKGAKGLYTDKTDYTLATPAALRSEVGVGALTFVGPAVPPNGQKSVSVDAVSSAYIVLSGQSKSGDCFYAADDQLTGPQFRDGTPGVWVEARERFESLGLAGLVLGDQREQHLTGRVTGRRGHRVENPIGPAAECLPRTAERSPCGARRCPERVHRHLQEDEQRRCVDQLE